MCLLLTEVKTSVLQKKILLALIFFIIDFTAPSTTVTTTKEDLVKYFKEMYTMRRMEITNDTEYKVIVSPFSSSFLTKFIIG